MYERVISRKAKGSALVGNVLLISTYALGVLLGICLILVSVRIAVLCLLLTFVLWLLTNRYLKVEYEYSFDSGRFSVAKIYGKRSRRPLLEIDLKQTVLTAPDDEENIPRAERLQIDKVVSVISHPQAQNTYFTVYENEKEQTVLVYFEGDERSLSYFKRANPICTTVRPFLHT